MRPRRQRVRERNPRQRERDKRDAQTFFAQLSDEQRNQLGDALVLGDFDWRDWGFGEPPSREFMRELDERRMAWETT